MESVPKSASRRRGAVPVTTGSPRYKTVQVAGFDITEAWFPPGLVIAPHTHDRACLAIMLEGGFDVDFAGNTEECTASTAVVEPQGEKHRNRVMSGGAHVLVVQPDPADERMLVPFRRIFGQVTNLRHPGLARLAWTMTGELHEPDAVSSLALEGLTLRLLSSACREVSDTRPTKGARVWPLRLRDYLHDRFLDNLRLADIAAEFDVHPVHLSRAFRERFGQTVGTYVRKLRLDWAATRLASSDDALGEIAVRAGFSDQSHFTRVFKRFNGVTPGQFRQTLRNGKRAGTTAPGPDRSGGKP